MKILATIILNAWLPRGAVFTLILKIALRSMIQSTQPDTKLSFLLIGVKLLIQSDKLQMDWISTTSESGDEEDLSTQYHRHHFLARRIQIAIFCISTTTTDLLTQSGQFIYFLVIDGQSKVTSPVVFVTF